MAKKDWRRQDLRRPDRARFDGRRGRGSTRRSRCPKVPALKLYQCMRSFERAIFSLVDDSQVMSLLIAF